MKPHTRSYPLPVKVPENGYSPMGWYKYRGAKKFVPTPAQARKIEQAREERRKK